MNQHKLGREGFAWETDAGVNFQAPVWILFMDVFNLYLPGRLLLYMYTVFQQYPVLGVAMRELPA